MASRAVHFALNAVQASRFLKIPNGDNEALMHFVEEIEEVPAQDAVDAGVRMAKALLEGWRQLVGRTGAGMSIDVSEQVFDEELAAEAIAEELDVRADDRPEIQQDRHRLLSERGQESGEPFGGDDRFVAHAGGSAGAFDAISTTGAPLEEV